VYIGSKLPTFEKTYWSRLQVILRTHAHTQTRTHIKREMFGFKIAEGLIHNLGVTVK